MIITVTLGVLCTISAFLARFESFKFGLKISFLFIFVFLALRYNFGNDYDGYLKDFIEFNTYNKVSYFNIADFHYEPGWLILCRAFKNIGFFAMVAFLAAFHCAAYYLLIKKYVPRKYFWLAIFIYIFTPNFLLLQASAMRQSVAISIFIFSLEFIYKRKPVQYAVCILLASSFHTSALVLLPFYFVTYLNIRFENRGMWVLVSFYLLLFLSFNMIGPYLNDIVSKYFPRYEVYQNGASVKSGFGVIYFSILFILLLYFDRFQDRRRSLLFKYSFISFIFIPLSLYINIASRLSMYFGVATIAAYPLIEKSINREAHRIAFSAFLIFITIYSFVGFFHSEIWRNSFGTYHTIFSAPQFY